MPDRPKIPSLTSDVDAAWVTQALRHSGVLQDASIVAMDGERIGAGVGILGELTRLSLGYDRHEPGAPQTVILKLPTADPGGRGIAQALGFYERETRFYRDLQPEVPLRTGRCYYADMQPSRVKYVLLLEDLAGLRLGDQLQGATADEARAVVLDLARLHAKFWQSPQLAALDWVPDGTSPLLQFVQGAFMMSLPPFLAQFGGLLSDRVKKAMADLGPLIPASLAKAVTRPMTLAHADARLDNIFFSPGDGPLDITWIDWQILIKATGAYDLAYFMSQSVEPEVRRAIEVPVLREYLAAITAAGVEDYSWDDLWYDYRTVVLYCLVYPVVAGGSIDVANERGLELVRRMAVRSATAVEDLDADELLADLR